MIAFLSRSRSIVTIATLLTVIIVCSLLLASGITLYSSYKFESDLAERSEFIISSNLQNGGLPFAVVTEDKELIKSIVDSHLKYEEVYSIEISGPDGTLIYRAANDNAETSVRIDSHKFNITSPYESVALEGFDAPETSPSPEILGILTIAFSTEKRDAAILHQVLLAGGVLLLAIGIIVCLLLIFNRLISKYLSKMIKTMAAIEKAEKLDWNEEYKPNVDEFSVMYNSLRQLYETINERDSRLKESLEEALDARFAAQQAEHFKDDFLRAISHDIRTPVGVVVNLLEIIDDQIAKHDVDDSIKDKLHACFQSAKVLSDVTGELFNLDQFQSMELTDNKEPTDASDLFDRIGSMYQGKFDKKGLGFSVVQDPLNIKNGPTMIAVDKRKVTLIIENIVDNAIKFTKSGWVSIEWGLKDYAIHITIKDSGIGIPEDKIQLIFEKHHQLQDPITSHHEGRGLGLYYVNRMLEVIQGEVQVSSKQGIGTAFNIQIPFTDVIECYAEEKYADEEQAEPTPVAAPNPTKNSGGLKVLIIDDDDATCFTLKEMLAQHGIVSTTENIPEIGYQRLIDESPDLVFIDYHMERLSGDKLAQKAQAIISPTATFFVCITAEGDPNSIKMLSGIFQEVYRKPFQSARLKEILHNVKNSREVTDSILTTLRTR